MFENVFFMIARLLILLLVLGTNYTRFAMYVSIELFVGKDLACSTVLQLTISLPELPGSDRKESI